MSGSISPAVAADQVATASRPRSPRPDERSHGKYFLLARQLAVITEMLETMDTLTVAGQRHTMSKVVGFVEDQVAHTGLPLSRRNQKMVAEVLRHLIDESQRLSPDIPVFTHHAESLVALLNAIG